MKEKEILERESIVGRMVEFLKVHPPFNFITNDELQALTKTTSLKYYDKDEAVFNVNDPLHDSIYVVRKGSIKIISQNNELIDQCGEGEIFGSRAFMSTELYQASAVADPEALIISLPVEPLRALIAMNAKLTEYFFGDFSSGVALRKRKLSEINQQYQNFKGQGEYRFSFERGFISSFKSPVTCAPTVTIQKAAQIMHANSVGSIIVTSDQNFPVGIITDTDLRNKVIARGFSTEEPVSAIMTSPVKTVGQGKTNEEYLLEMIALGAHHLCVTETGLPNSPIVGVVTDHDLLVSRGNNAAVLAKELRRTENVHTLKTLVDSFDVHITKLVQHDYPILDIAKIVRSFNQQLVKKVIEISQSKLGFSLDPTQYCLLALGSTARGEQIIRTDFDSAIIVANDYKEHIPQIEKLANEVFDSLIEIGYQADKAGIQANNPKWIKSLADWENQFMKWIEVPDEQALLHATIFFDLMPFFGEPMLAERLQKLIFKAYRGNHSYTAFLATNALQNPPPLGFFKNLLLEKSGEHKNSFDIKLRAIMPLADAARLKALEHNTMFPSNTIQRYQRLAEKDAANASKYEDCAAAYEIFMRLRASEGLEHQHDGRFLNPANLGQLEKQILKNAFKPISEIQHMIKPA